MKNLDIDIRLYIDRRPRMVSWGQRDMEQVGSPSKEDGARSVVCPSLILGVS